MTRPAPRLVWCAYGRLDPGEVEVAHCQESPTRVITVAGQTVEVCEAHLGRARVLARLVEADRVDRIIITTAATLSCPPNNAHPGTVEWSLAGTGNACPVCGRFA